MILHTRVFDATNVKVGFHGLEVWKCWIPIDQHMLDLRRESDVDQHAYLEGTAG